MLYIGYWGWRTTKNIEDYFVAGRQLGPWVLSFSFFATLFSTAAMLGGGGSGFQMGFQWTAYLIFFNAVSALIAWYVIGPRLKSYVDKAKSLTIPDFFEIRYGSRIARVVAAVIIIIFFEFYMISIYKGCGNLFQEMLHVPYVVGILISVVTVMIYTSIGGFKAVTLTDLIQGIMMLGGTILLFVLIMFHIGGWSSGVEQLRNLTLVGNIPGTALLESGKMGPTPIVKAGKMLPFVVSLAFAIAVAQISSPQLLIRFYGARDQRALSRGMIIAPLIIGIFCFTMYSCGPFAWLVIPKMAGAQAVSTYLKDPDLVVPFLINKLFPPVLGAFMLSAIVAAAMSTINSLLLVLATSLGKDILQVISPRTSERAILNTTRLMGVVFAIIPLLLAIKPPGIIVTIVGLSFSVITAAFLVPLVFGLFWSGGTGLAAWVSMVVATGTCIIWQLVYYPVYWIYPVVPGLIASAVAFLVVSVISKGMVASRGFGIDSCKEV